MILWVMLIIAGVFECAWAVGLKYTEGFTRLWPSVFTVGAMAISLFLLSRALREIPLGTAYAVWTGIGAVGVAIIGMVFFDDSREVARVISIGFIIAGIVGLKLFGGPAITA